MVIYFDPQSAGASSNETYMDGDIFYAQIYDYTNAATIDLSPYTSDQFQILTLSLPLALHLQGGLEMDINQYNRCFLPKNSFLFLYMGTRYTEGNFYQILPKSFNLITF